MGVRQVSSAKWGWGAQPHICMGPPAGGAASQISDVRLQAGARLTLLLGEFPPLRESSLPLRNREAFCQCSNFKIFDSKFNYVRTYVRILNNDSLKGIRCTLNSHVNWER